MKQKNISSNGLLFDTCKHFRCVRDNNFSSYHLSGIVIDSFAYAAIGSWRWLDSGESPTQSFRTYEQILLSFFESTNTYWSPLKLTAPGSGDSVEPANSISCLEKVLRYMAE